VAVVVVAIVVSGMVVSGLGDGCGGGGVAVVRGGVVVVMTGDIVDVLTVLAGRSVVVVVLVREVLRRGVVVEAT
jgi:hypothetical protein